MDFAIVGMDCLLPGADGAEAWIARCRRGEPAIGPVPEGRWPLDPAGADAGAVGVPDHTATTLGAFVQTDVEVPEDLDVAGLPIGEMDPLFAWVLRVTGGALEGVTLDRSRTRLLLGNLSLPSSGSVRAAGAALAEALGATDVPWLRGGTPWDRQHSELPALLAAHAFGLGAGATSLDAACASGLYAVRLACDQLEAGEVDAVVAAGVNRADSAYLHIGFSQLRALSATGTPLPFDQRANGLVVGEGAAAVVIKRLADAVADGDTIHGVIRGGGIGNDGKSGNLLSPDSDGQLRTLQAAWARAGLDPASAGYIECHATAAPLGDRTELASLHALVGDVEAPIALGSAKALIGHTVTVAGLAGLIRAVGAVRDGFLPPGPHCTQPMDGVDGTVFRVPTEAESWEAPVRRAAVSAFGFGGTNAHVIVEDWREGTEASTGSPAASPTLAIVGIGAHVGSADSAAALVEALRAGRSLIGAAPLSASRGLDLPDGAYVDEVRIDPRRFRIPPLELAQTLPQHLCMLQAAADALEGLALDGDVGSITGMALDHHIGDNVLRWALGSAGEGVAPPLSAQRVQAGLPNFVANRIAAQFDLRGPSYTVSAGALSGLVAIRQAARLIANGTCTAVVVGASELAGHAGAAQYEDEAIGEGAVALVLMEEEAAKAAGLPIHGRISVATPGEPSTAHRALLGHGHAVDGLFAVVHALATDTAGIVTAEAFPSQAAAVSLQPSLQVLSTRAAVAEPIRIPHSGPPLARPGFAGAWGGDTVPRPLPGTGPVDGMRFAGEYTPVEPEAMPFFDWVGRAPPFTPLGSGPAPGTPLGSGPERQQAGVPVAPPGTPLGSGPERQQAGVPVASLASSQSDSGPRLAARASRLPGDSGPGVAARASRLPGDSGPGVAGRASRLPAAKSTPQQLLRPERPIRATSGPAQMPRSSGAVSNSDLPELAASMARAADAAASAHQVFLDNQMRELAELERVTAMLTRATEALSTGGLSPISVPERQQAGIPVADPGTPLGSGPAPFTPLGSGPAPGTPLGSGPERQQAGVPVASLASSQSDSGPGLAARASRLPGDSGPRLAARASRLPGGPGVAGPASRLPGAPRQFDRDALVIHATGKISDVFGPTYADLDPYEPRVRMPADPLLLASRVVDIEGERGVLGPSRIITEYDLPPGAWWAHDGKAPPCVCVESGQADLFLVSWLGIDAECRGERVYRLLDCDLTFHGSRPEVGETLRHDIRINNFARLGDTILFYFEYDCISKTDGRSVLSMRNGCAGFFTPQELARPQGVVLPEPTASTATVTPLLPAPPTLNEAGTLALAEGRYSDAFGPAFAPADGSTLTLPPSQWRLVHRVRDIALSGGVHGLGGALIEQDLRDDDWFNPCHFVGDPCMPGTFMFDGCMQALQVWLMAAGFPAEYPNATFEPIDDVACKLRCRGQVVPGHSLLTYEVRVKDHGLSPAPWAIADVVLSVDGTAVVFAEDVGVRIEGERVPLADAAHPDAPQVPDDLVMEYSVGSAQRAFGPEFADYDGTWPRCARMPGPPYLGMSRVISVEGARMEVAEDRTVVIDYDVPEQAWYFDAEPSGSMPWAILLEIGLQPCGWITAWQGACIRGGRDLYFRNLGGSGQQLKEVWPTTKRLRTIAKQTGVSDSAGMTLHFFEVTMLADGEPCLKLVTHFGYFSKKALSDQKGLSAIDVQEERRIEAREGHRTHINLRTGIEGLPRLDLLMLDRVSVANPDGGKAGLGYYEGEFDVNPDHWFYTAHFHLDPVMPGSLGLESLLQLARWVLFQKHGVPAGRLRPLLLNHEVAWKYRGQVPLEREKVTVELDVTEISDNRILCDGLVRADGLPIYTFTKFGFEYTHDGEPETTSAASPRTTAAAALLDRFDVQGDTGTGVLRLDPAQHPWLADHCPTLTAPAVPMAFAAEIAAEAATLIRPGAQVVAIPTLEAQKWIHCAEGPVDLLVAAVADGDTVAVSLALHHENREYPQLSGPKVHMKAVVQLGDAYPEAPPEPAPLEGLQPVEQTPADYYASGLTFHGPTLQGFADLGQRGPTGAISTFRTMADAELLGSDAVPGFVLDPLLLDTATHPMMSGEPEVWDASLPSGKLAYPLRAEDMRFYGPRPSGPITCRIDKVPVGDGLLAFDVRLSSADGVWCTYRWVETLVDAGPVLGAPIPERKPFANREPVDVRIGRATDTGWRVEAADLVEPLPGTIVTLTCTEHERDAWLAAADRTAWSTAQLAGKEAVRRWLHERLGRLVHPARVQLLRMRDDLFVVTEAPCLTAQEYVDHLGPTRFDLHLRTGDGWAEAWVTSRG